MSLCEIEAAMETLPPDEFRKLRRWIVDRHLDVASADQPHQRLGVAEGEFEIPLSFYDPLPDDILDAFEGK